MTPCEICHAPGLEGTKRCNRCWELEHRLEGYLREGSRAAMVFVLEALRKAVAS